MATTHLNVGLDAELDRRLRESALKFERTLTQEARYALRKHLQMDAPAAEASVDV